MIDVETYMTHEHETRHLLQTRPARKLCIFVNNIELAQIDLVSFNLCNFSVFNIEYHFSPYLIFQNQNAVYIYIDNRRIFQINGLTYAPDIRSILNEKLTLEG